MIRVATNCCLLALVLALNGCKRPAAEESKEVQEQYLSVPNSVGFNIEPLPKTGNSYAWLATYTSNGKTAKFRIELGASRILDGTGSKQFGVIDVKSGEGKFIAEPGSDASVLLTDLKNALEAKKLPSNVRRAESLSFNFVSFGSDQSQAREGGFTPTPPGHWTPMKIFIGEGDQQGELFLNLNPVLKKGQFSIKDPDYGDIVLSRLAEVL